jgi:hypothetical protein
MRKIFLFAVLLLCSFLLRAQFESFDLSTYKLPDITRHKLDFNIDFDGNSYTTDQNYRNKEDNYSKSNSFDGDLNLDYAFYRNSDKIQSNQWVGVDFSPSFYNIKNDGLKSDNLNLNGSIYLNSRNRFYLNINRFIETNLDFYWNRNKIEENINSFGISTLNSKNISLLVSVKLGFGRIEEVQNARLAIYILDELNKEGSLARIPDEEEILEFAKLISKLKSERFFDSRKKKIYEIEQVDIFLQSRGIVQNANSKYFTVVNDNWDYAALPNRRTGHRISFGITPELNYQNADYQYDDIYYLNTNNENYRKEYGLSANLNFALEKPINLYWQSSLYVNLSGKYLKGINEKSLSNSIVEIESPELHSNINYSIGFYPSSRTDMNLSLGLYFKNSFGSEFVNDEKNNINFFYLLPNSRININYYISPQFKLNINYYMYYRYLDSNSEYYDNMYNDFKTGQDINQNISIGFIYQIL